MKKTNQFSKNREKAKKKPATIHPIPSTREGPAVSDGGPDAGAPQKLIVVLGMHRSGTSAVTRALRVLGVDLGDKLYPPMAGVNDKGFWEDIDLNTFDMEVLGAIGSDWHELKPIQASDLEYLRLKGYSLRAMELVREKVGAHSVFGLKDPRLARLLPFWKSIFENQSEWKICYLIAIRNPLSVVKSLTKRNGFDSEKSFLLWLGHVLTSLIDTTGETRIVVDYDQLMEAPGPELKRMAHGLDLTIDPAELRVYEHEFLDKSLQHSVYRPGDLNFDDACPPLVREIYTALLDAASDRLSVDDPTFQNRISHWKVEFDRLASPLRLMDKLYVRIDAAARLASEREKEVAGFKHAIGERESRIASLNNAVTESGRQVASLQRIAAEQTHQISELKQTITLQENHASVLDRSIAERESRIASLNNAIAESGRQVASLQQIAAEQTRQILELKQTITLQENHASVLINANAEKDRQIAALTETCGKYGQLTHGLNQSIRERESELAFMLRSKSWILTSPLRAIRRILIDGPHLLFRQSLSNTARFFWYLLPLPSDIKQQLKAFAFRNFPILLSSTKAYRDWKDFVIASEVASESESVEDEILPVSESTADEISLAPESMDTSSLPEANAGYLPVAHEYVPLLHEQPLIHKPAKLICFYLPQFHPIPENDAWWGEGFTEWTNVQPAAPQFAGHYQPRIPGELGYYNLLDPAVQRRQVELARLYGIEAFCFYFYWFEGKRLLETPIQNYLSDKTLDLSFCLCWANENWSRRWDGLDSEILIAQEHSPDDDLAFVEHVSRYMQDARYLRIDGKPLLLVYRPSLLPSAKETSDRWRGWCRNHGIGEIYLAYTQSFEAVDPAVYGFDAAVEFPPNNSCPPKITEDVQPFNGDFACTVYDWSIFVQRSEPYQPPDYKLFRGVCPSWDNTPRRRNESTVFLNSTPDLYRKWLKNAIDDTVSRQANPDERLIFINAWNEWAEGAHLEPDALFGYAYLQATRDALSSGDTGRAKESGKIIVVAHDALPNGAQFLALNLAKTLNQGMGFHVDLVCLGNGPLKSEYAKWSTLHDLSNFDPRGPEAHALARTLYETGYRSALVNTTASGHFLETLARNGIRCVALVHELRGVLDQLNLYDKASSIREHATRIVFPAQEVANAFPSIEDVDSARIFIRHQGLYKRINKSCDRVEVRRNLRQKLELPEDSLIVLGVGYADYRKGIDLFVDAGLKMARRIPRARWVWVGHWDEDVRYRIDQRIGQSKAAKDLFVFPGLQSDTDLFYGGADVFALTSREDPFPSVVLEALDAELPVVAFEGAGGFTGLLREGCGCLAAHEKLTAFGNAVAELLEKPRKRKSLGRRGAGLINERFSFRHYIFDLLDLSGMGLKRVSAIVPNFNYAKYLPERLSSITTQTYPVYEIIFLDDCSTDDSVEVAQKILGSQPIDYQVIVNDQNSRSVFAQWHKGLEAASGDYIWIAEADDFAEPAFLHEVISAFSEGRTVMSYCQSRQIDSTGRLLGDNYLEYVSDISTERWLEPYEASGEDEIRSCLSIKNTIPNVSAVVFRRDTLKDCLSKHLEEIRSMKVAGDWLTYLYILQKGNISYSSKSCNSHRRHPNSVTLDNFNLFQLKEILYLQKKASELVQVDQVAREKAIAYSEYLYRYFGFANADAPSLFDHPELGKFDAALI